MVRNVVLGALGLAILASLACSRKPAPESVTAPVNGNANANANEAHRAAPSEGAHGSRKKKNIDVPVMVDGAFVATLRFGELPLGLVAHKKNDRGEARYFRVDEYLKALGVPVAHVRSIHARGNLSRIASVEGDELRREPARFVFDFLEGKTGIAKTAWDTTGLRNTFRIDEIRELLVYVDREAPALDARRSCYLEGSACSAKVPYSETEIVKGTRVYLDGKLVGQVKRRRLGSELVVGTNEKGVHEFALTKLLASFGVDPAKTRAIELIAGDVAIGAASGAELTRRSNELRFTLPQHQSGRVLLSVPAGWQAPSREVATSSQAAEVTAVLVFKDQTPPKRLLTPITTIRAPELLEKPDRADAPPSAEEG